MGRGEEERRRGEEEKRREKGKWKKEKREIERWLEVALTHTLASILFDPQVPTKETERSKEAKKRQGAKKGKRRYLYICLKRLIPIYRV